MLPLSPYGYMLQGVSFGLAGMLLVGVLMWCYFNRGLWRYAVPIITIAVHTLCYYAAIFLNNSGTIQIPNPLTFFADWSALLRVHTLAVLVMVELFRLHTSLQRRVHENGHLD